MTAYKDGEEAVYPVEIEVPSGLFRRLEAWAADDGQDVEEFCFWILWNHAPAEDPGYQE